MERPEIKVTVREYHPGQTLSPTDATRPTLLVEELEMVIAALTAQGVSPDRINALLDRPDIKCLLPRQPKIRGVQE